MPADPTVKGSGHARLTVHYQCDHSQLGEQAGPAPVPPGTGAGGTCSGRDTELAIGGALAAAGAVAGAGAFQHSRTTVSDRVTEDIEHIDRLAPHKRTGDEMTR